MNNTWRHINVAEIMTKSIQHISDEKLFDIFLLKVWREFHILQKFDHKNIFCHKFSFEMKNMEIIELKFDTSLHLHIKDAHNPPYLLSTNVYLPLVTVISCSLRFNA